MMNFELDDSGLTFLDNLTSLDSDKYNDVFTPASPSSQNSRTASSSGYYSNTPQFSEPRGPISPWAQEANSLHVNFASIRLDIDNQNNRPDFFRTDSTPAHNHYSRPQFQRHSSYPGPADYFSPPPPQRHFNHSVSHHPQHHNQHHNQHHHHNNSQRRFSSNQRGFYGFPNEHYRYSDNQSSYSQSQSKYEWQNGGLMTHSSTHILSESEQILKNAAQFIEKNDDKTKLKIDLCRYLETVPLNAMNLCDGVDLICIIQEAFDRTLNSEICTELCHEKSIITLVGYLHENRGQMFNDQLLKTARALLRLTWSLTYTTISDLLDTLRPTNQRFGIEELVLFCQCQHNYHLLKNLNPNTLRCMGETARELLPALPVNDYQDLNDPLYTATVVFKCFGKDFSPFQVNAVANIFKELASYNMICLENLHKDGRSTVIHLLDACFRANVLKDSYSQDQFEEIYDHCCAEISRADDGSVSINMTVQDISAVLRALQDFTSQKQVYFKTLNHVANAMLKRMQLGEANAKDFVKNMRNLTAKCFFKEELLENFCILIERDLDEACHCQRQNCVKSCRSLNFWSIADALDIISTPNYVYKKDMDAHIAFLSKMATRMCSDVVWDSLMKSFYDNKIQKLFFTLVGFQTYGYYPMQLINCEHFYKYIYDLYQSNQIAQIQRFQKWYDIKEKDYNLRSFHPASGNSRATIFDDFFIRTGETLTPPEPIHNLQQMERKVLKALSEIEGIEITQRHGINRKYSHFLVNGDTAVLPISRKRLLRNREGTIEDLARVNGRFGTYKRLLEAQYGSKMVIIPHFEFEPLGSGSDQPSLAQVAYIKNKLSPAIPALQ